MRRSVIEWAMVCTLVFLSVTALAWLDSVTFRLLNEPLALGPDLFFRFDNERICVFSDLGDDWKPQEFGKLRRTLTWPRSYTNWFFPGIEFHHRRMSNGHAIWSFEIAPILPIGAALLFMVVLWRLRTRFPTLPAPRVQDDAASTLKT